MNRNLRASQIKDIFYPLLKLAIPLALTGILQSSIFFFQTLFLASLGPQILAAGALVSFLFATLVVILFGTLTSINILVSHKHGAHDQLGISLVVRDGLLLALLLTIPAFVLLWNISHLFLIFGQNPAIVLLSTSYLHALTWGLLPSFIMVVLLQLIIGLGHVRTIMMFTILSVSLNIFFSYALIFGKFGLPALSIAGAGWGTTISYWIVVMVLLTYVLTHEHYKKYFHKLFSNTKPSYLWELIHVGTPMGAMYSIEIGFFLVLTLLMGSIGSELLAANQIVLQYMGVVMSVIVCIAQAVTVRMGHLLGAKEINSAKHVNYAGIFISASLMGLVAMCYWFFPRILISVDFDIHDPHNFKMVHDIERLLAIGALFQIFEAMRISLFGALRALHDTHFTLLTSTISFWCVALPIGYLLAVKFDLGGPGFWWGMVVGAGFSVALLSLRFESKIAHYDRRIKNK